MSSYYRETKHPETGKYESALWLDDYFSHHHYGVKFPDGKVFDPEKVKLKTRSTTKLTLSDEITDFLSCMGIPRTEQEDDYRLEVAYRKGYEDALRNYAIWKDGVQRVGAMQTPLGKVLMEFQTEDIPLRY